MDSSSGTCRLPASGGSNSRAGEPRVGSKALQFGKRLPDSGLQIAGLVAARTGGGRGCPLEPHPLCPVDSAVLRGRHDGGASEAVDSRRPSVYAHAAGDPERRLLGAVCIGADLPNPSPTRTARHESGIAEVGLPEPW